MTEDEAFVRAIVDRPGDDTARLVYADWLDDRDDPRGPYLRAEAEWVRTGDASRLNDLAAELDPVWVARVSRPPVGVCCDHVTFRDRGPVLAAADIDRLEARFGNFGPQFRAFLLNYNGGVPSPAYLEYPAPLQQGFDLEVADFSRLRRAEDPDRNTGIEAEHEHLEFLYGESGHEGPNPHIANMLAIAFSQDDLGYILIGTGSANRGRVYHFSDYCHNTDNPENLFDFFPTFAEFLAQLRPDRDAN